MKKSKITKENFWEDLVTDNNGCWSKLCTPLDSEHRYRAYVFEGRKIRPSSIAWFMVNGEFPLGELWSTCNNVRCINPDHHREIRNDHDRYIYRIYKNPNNGCWEWGGFITPDGYGCIRVKSRVLRVHRFSYEHYIGRIPEGLDVLHKCDNRKCSNPDHLFLGTDLDNSIDREIKERNPHKLNAKLVREIRSKFDNGERITVLCKTYNINKQNMYRLVNKISWRWVE